MRIDVSKLNTEHTCDIRLYNMLPSIEMARKATALIVKHKEDMYLVKCRPSYEKKLAEEDFLYIKKSEMTLKEINKLLDDVACKYIVYDATGYKLTLEKQMEDKNELFRI